MAETPAEAPAGAEGADQAAGRGRDRGRVSRRRLLTWGGISGLLGLGGLAVGERMGSGSRDVRQYPPVPGQSESSLELHARSADGTTSWVPGQAAVARAIGWAVVTDPTWAGGAVGDGRADDTAAVRAAAASGRTVFFPAGEYRGSFDLDVPSPRLVGADRTDVRLVIEDGHFLVDSDQVWTSTRVEQLSTVGGRGVLRNRYTGTNVTGQHVVTDCDFQDYTAAAISHESPDMPLWRIERCLFRAGDQTTGIGIALNGLTDASTVQRCEFRTNRVHVKLGDGGNNAYLGSNDFLQYEPPRDAVRRTMVWAVPAAEATNAGAGLVLADNKFGNENLGSADLRIAYADEGDGEFFGDRLPDLDGTSTGHISGHTIRGGLVAGSTSNPLIYSTTPMVRGCAVTGVVLAGTLPSYVLEMRSPTDSFDPEAHSNLAGPFHVVDQDFSPFPVSNQAGLFRLDDPNQVLDAWPDNPLALRGGGAAAGHVSLLRTRIPGFELTGGATTDPLTDALGGGDAIDAVLLRGGGIVGRVPAGALQADQPVWVEFDLRQAGDAPLDEVSVTFGEDSAGSGAAGQYLRRRVRPVGQWRPYRFLTVSPRASDSVVLRFQASDASRGRRVQLGRVRMYHAREPLPADLVLPDTETTQRAPAAGTAQPLPATPAGYLTVYVNGAARQIAFY